jgi:hypothetical protein
MQTAYPSNLAWIARKRSQQVHDFIKTRNVRNGVPGGEYAFLHLDLVHISRIDSGLV